jgi:hypothetical protein
VADCRNHRIRLCRRTDVHPAAWDVETLVGDGKADHKDGPMLRASLSLPCGIILDPLHEQRLFIMCDRSVDLRVADLKTQMLSTLTLLNPRAALWGYHAPEGIAIDHDCTGILLSCPAGIVRVDIASQ